MRQVVAIINVAVKINDSEHIEEEEPRNIYHEYGGSDHDGDLKELDVIE